jgi:hypothetical protein
MLSKLYFLISAAYLPLAFSVVRVALILAISSTRLVYPLPLGIYVAKGNTELAEAIKATLTICAAGAISSWASIFFDSSAWEASGAVGNS